MAPSELPARPSLEYLKKLAKERLRALRSTDPDAKLADAQRAVAREHGFSSWRALKAEVDRRAADAREAFFAACAEGNVAALRVLLDAEPGLAGARDRHGATALHAALAHPEAVRLLLERGADPNARDAGDNALPLHFAAAGAPIETVHALLDAGSDVEGEGDEHGLDVIGWAACFAEPRRDVVALLLERGARHHVFSAVATADHDALRRLAAEDPGGLARRLSRHEQEQTALHYCVAPPDGLVGGLFRTGEHHATLALLVELGADLEATDARGRTPLALAMLRGDEEAMRILHRAGARPPAAPDDEGASGVPTGRRSRDAPATDRQDAQAMDRRDAPATDRQDAPAAPTAPPALDVSLATSVRGLVPMIAVPDIDAAVAWYRAVGFELTGSNGAPGKLDWAEVKLGDARLMFAFSGDAWRPATRGLGLWLYTNRIDALHAELRRRQLSRAGTLLEGGTPRTPEIRFRTDLYTTQYGMREFTIEDPHGIGLTFAQPVE